MSNAVLIKLADEREKLVEFVDETLSRAAEESRDLVEAETRNLNSTRERITAIDAQMGPLNEFEAVRSSAIEIDRRVTTSPRTPKGADLRAEVNESLGRLWVGSDQYRGYRGGHSGRYEIESIRPSEVRATLSIGAAPGQLLLPTPQRYTSEAPNYLTPLLSAIQRIQVSTGTVEVISYDDPSGAAVVPEGTLKPDIAVGVNIDTVTLQTIAGVIYATRQFMQDVSAAEAFINGNLTRAVLKELENQILGVIQAAAIPTLAFLAGEELLAWTRRASAEIQTKGYTADTLLAHPNDLANIDLQILSLGGSAQAVVGASAWGLRAIPVASLTAGEPYIMDSSAAVVLYERSGVSVYSTDSDVLGSGATATSGFRSNVITTLAEGRAAAHVPVPSAAIKASPFVGP